MPFLFSLFRQKYKFNKLHDGAKYVFLIYKVGTPETPNKHLSLIVNFGYNLKNILLF